MSEDPGLRGDRVSRIKEDICMKRGLFDANIITSDMKQVDKTDSGKCLQHHANLALLLSLINEIDNAFDFRLV